MANTHHWVYASRIQAERVRDAFAYEEGLPRKSVRVTPGAHVDIPATFAAGAAGWSRYIADVDDKPVPPGPPEYAVQRAAGLSAHEGKQVNHPVHGVVDLPVQASAVARGPEWDPGP